MQNVLCIDFSFFSTGQNVHRVFFYVNRSRRRTMLVGVVTRAIKTAQVLAWKEGMLRLVSDHPDLKPFVITDVKLTGRRIGAGAYSRVEEVVVAGAVCVAKIFHDVTLLDPSQISQASMQSSMAKFVEECQLMSTLRHPHVVQFLGVCVLPDNTAAQPLPALVMERLTCSLHHMLENNPTSRAKPRLPLSMKCSLLQNVASGLAHLHSRSPPVVHLNLSARNILLDSAATAKIADFGAARIFSNTGAVPTIITEASVYMPPEVVSDALSHVEKSKEASSTCSIDIFSLGIVTIFTLGETYPCKPLEPTYTDEQNGLLKFRTELERRSHYLQSIRAQLDQGHPLLTLIESCLCNNPADRPTIDKVLALVEQARRMCAGVKLESIESLRSQQENEVYKMYKTVLKR